MDHGAHATQHLPHRAGTPDRGSGQQRKGKVRPRKASQGYLSQDDGAERAWGGPRVPRAGKPARIPLRLTQGPGNGLQ